MESFIHPFSKPLKILLMAITALAASLLVAAPAHAQDPQTLPFSVQDPGEDDCTIFYSDGQIRQNARSTHEPPSLTVTGRKTIAIPGVDPEQPHPCLPHPNFDRQVEFRFSGAGMPLGEHIVPFEPGESSAEFEFDFASHLDADTVTIAICLEQSFEDDGITWPSRCGEEQTIVFETIPGDPHCEHFHSVVQWDGGFLFQLSITLLGPASTGWQVEIGLPEGSAVNSVWNAEWEQDDSTLILTEQSWNGTIGTGGTVQIGFTGSGEPPLEPLVSVDGRRCAPAEVR